MHGLIKDGQKAQDNEETREGRKKEANKEALAQLEDLPVGMTTAAQLPPSDSRG